MANLESILDLLQQAGLDRRSFLKKGITASGLLGLSAVIPPRAIAHAAGTPQGKSARNGRDIPSIDVHVHYLPGTYSKALKDNGQAEADGVPIPKWNPEEHLAVMDRLNISTAMLSISSPHFHFGDDAAACALARELNEDGAKLVSTYPGRFGLLAALPLPDVDGSLREMEYAFDVLNADGIRLTTHSAGVYLGDKRLEPIFAELGRRQAVVVLHPVKPSAVPANILDDCPAPVMEFLMDTTRTITNLILNGTLQRNPGIKFVVPHAGAFLPSLTDRLDGLIKTLPPEVKATIPDVRDSLRNMYYDLAGFPVPLQLGALLQMTDYDHLLYGSDWPYTFEGLCVNLKDQLLATELLTDKQRQAIFRDNALAIFPRLNQTL